MGNPKVAIVGAGPAGCMLARLLHLKGIGTTVFEGDGDVSFRSQGGTLDLHADTGLLAMQEAELFDEFKKHARYDGQWLLIADKKLESLITLGADSKVAGERPEIDRSTLREMLAASLPEGMIQWGHHLRRVEGNTLVFDDMTATGFDLIVGADGAWSHTRKAIAPDLQPAYIGVAMFDLSIPEAETKAPELYKLVNRGSIFASSEGQRVALQQLGSGGINIFASFLRQDPDWSDQGKCGYDAHDLAAVKRALAEEFHDWDPRVLDSFERAEGDPVPRSLYALPVGGRWTHTPGITLLGDAAHLMCPYAGEGVNQAFDDARLLAAAVAESARTGGDLDAAVKGFEDKMAARVFKIQRLSDDLLHDWFFTPGAPRSVMGRAMSRHVNQGLPKALHPFVRAFLSSYFGVKNMVA